MGVSVGVPVSTGDCGGDGALAAVVEPTLHIPVASIKAQVNKNEAGSTSRQLLKNSVTGEDIRLLPPAVQRAANRAVEHAQTSTCCMPNDGADYHVLRGCKAANEW